RRMYYLAKVEKWPALASQVYKSLIRPVLTRCLLLVSKENKASQLLQKKQNEALRKISGALRSTPQEDLHSLTKVPTIARTQSAMANSLYSRMVAEESLLSKDFVDWIS